MTTNINHEYFKKYCNLIYEKTGIFISDNKKDLFTIKLNKALRKVNASSFEEHFKQLQQNSDQEYYQQFLNIITTNTTEFFREREHFEYIKENLTFILKNNPRILKNKEIRIWSAGCSSGEEPVTMAIVLKECLGEEFAIKILATDINTKVLKKAITGIYSPSECTNIPKAFLYKYFNKFNEGFATKEEIKSCITYRYLNLKQTFHFKNGFDMIFCRNVMIYFDLVVQEKLVNEYYKHLVEGGLFFIGHSESLTNKRHPYKHISPSIYMKPVK